MLSSRDVHGRDPQGDSLPPGPPWPHVLWKLDQCANPSSAQVGNRAPLVLNPGLKGSRWHTCHGPGLG